MALSLQAVAENLWVIDHPLEIMKVRLGTRTTVVRLSNGGLWLLGPGAGLEQLQTQLDAIGPVVALVAPNVMHHMFLPSAARLWPQAQVFGPKGLKNKQPQLKFEPLQEQAPELWAADLQQQRLAGMGMLQETVFYHPLSKSLIVTDLVFNHQHSEHGWTRLFMRLNDAYGKLGPSRMLRKLVIKEPAALAQSLEQIFQWDFDKLIVSHGELLLKDAKAQLKASFYKQGILQ